MHSRKLTFARFRDILYVCYSGEHMQRRRAAKANSIRLHLRTAIAAACAFLSSCTSELHTCESPYAWFVAPTICVTGAPETDDSRHYITETLCEARAVFVPFALRDPQNHYNEFTIEIRYMGAAVIPGKSERTFGAASYQWDLTGQPEREILVYVRGDIRAWMQYEILAHEWLHVAAFITGLPLSRGDDATMHSAPLFCYDREMNRYLTIAECDPDSIEYRLERSLAERFGNQRRIDEYNENEARADHP